MQTLAACSDAIIILGSTVKTEKLRLSRMRVGWLYLERTSHLFDPK
jgi:hypothetical protein